MGEGEEAIFRESLAHFFFPSEADIHEELIGARASIWLVHLPRLDTREVLPSLDLHHFDVFRYSQNLPEELCALGMLLLFLITNFNVEAPGSLPHESCGGGLHPHRLTFSEMTAHLEELVLNLGGSLLSMSYDSSPLLFFNLETFFAILLSKLPNRSVHVGPTGFFATSRLKV